MRLPRSCPTYCRWVATSISGRGLVVIATLLLIGCASTGEVAALRQQLGELHVRVGGEGDSILSWLREVGFWILAAILYYPVIHRPLRLWKSSRNRR